MGSRPRRPWLRWSAGPRRRAGGRAPRPRRPPRPTTRSRARRRRTSASVAWWRSGLSWPLKEANDDAAFGGSWRWWIRKRGMARACRRAPPRHRGGTPIRTLIFGPAWVMLALESTGWPWPCEQLVGRAAELGVARPRPRPSWSGGRRVRSSSWASRASARRGCSPSWRRAPTAAGWLVLTGSASELERELPFWVFVDALDEYVQALEPRRLDALDERRARRARPRAAVARAAPRAAARRTSATASTARSRGCSRRWPRRKPLVLAARRPALGRLGLDRAARLAAAAAARRARC